MRRVRPDYYKKFQCIADKCTITCCQEWKIGVDNETNRKWKKLFPPDTVVDKKKNLSAYTVKKDGMRVIVLDEKLRCPFLNEEKLCRLVCTYTDRVLSDTCTQFPREVHRFSTYEEETLMPCCPAVIDIWKDAEKIVFPKVDREYKNLLFVIREHMMELLEDSTQRLEDQLKQGFYILLELNKQDSLTMQLINEYFSSESAAQLREAISQIPMDELDSMDECNELLQDLAVNYQKEGLYKKYLDPILLQAEKLSETYVADTMCENLQLFDKQFRQWQPLLRKFLLNEFYSDLLVPDGNLESMIVSMQWIGMEYAVIRHSVFLKWMERKQFTYEELRDYMVVITRMTGYEQEDIVEYLKNSFESLVWDWGYFALVTGA
ncbi:MAG: flagellin lysine-N-methylase [Lachnobacterium sp.]|nr:flagellin lysine-N-methylase [Lachnobacterium sp.]